MIGIGIDIGTTTISAVVLEKEESRVLESRTVPNDNFIKTANDWERIQDVPGIIKTAKALLDELLLCYPETVSIGLTGQMHGILYADQEGNCVSPLYTWQDQRGNLTGSSGKSLVDELREECGGSISTGYGMTTHIWLARKNEIPDKAVCLCTVPDYFGMALTGRQRPLLHDSMAASLGFFDAAGRKFETKKLETLGINTSVLPEVTEDFSVLGSYQGRLVTVAIGDNQAGFLGSVGQEKGTVLLNMGTGGQVSVQTDHYFEAEGIECRPFTKDFYLAVGSSLCGGRAYALLEQFFRDYMVAAGGPDREQYDVMRKLAAQTEGEDPMLVITTFCGSRTDPGLRGSISNLSEDNFTPQGMTRGVLAGMARELYNLYLKIYRETGIKAKALIGSGNGLRKNAPLQQIFSQQFGLPFRLAACKEEAASGAALIGIQQVQGAVAPTKTI